MRKLPVLILLGLYLSVWVLNLIKFCQCDFDAPWKSEIIHGIGVFLPPTSIVTVWL